MRALFATSYQPHSRDIFLNQKILPLNKLIYQREGMLAYQYGMHVLAFIYIYIYIDILTDILDLHGYELRNYENLRIPLHTVNY